MSFCFRDSEFSPEIGESLRDKLRPSSGHVIKSLLDSLNCCFAFLEEPSQCLNNNFLASCISSRSELLLNKRFEFGRKLDLHDVCSDFWSLQNTMSGELSHALATEASVLTLR